MVALCDVHCSWDYGFHSRSSDEYFNLFSVFIALDRYPIEGV
jgi:hypothetical protein